MKTTTLTRNDTARFLTERDNFVILSHCRPDGDTTGSAAALCLGLRQLGKTAHVLKNPEISPRFAWLHQGLTKDAAQPVDTLVCVDTASPTMVPKAFAPWKDAIQLRIDHHGSATSFTHWELVDPASASCAEIIWDLLMAMGVQPDRQIAEAAYVGLSTDTGCFRYANTTAHTFSVAAQCAQAGARIYQLNQELFETNTLARLKMQAWIVEHMHLIQDGQMAVCAIPKDVELALGVTEDDMDNISSFPRTVAGVKMAATLRQSSDGGTKLSVRAIPGCDATLVAVRFGGGGHKGAAGGMIHLPLEAAAQAVEAAMLSLTQGQ